MKALVDYDSEGQSERGSPTSKSPDEAPGQLQSVPDVDAIIGQTRAEMEEARLKADQLICQFAEAYVDAAGRIRDASIQHYRERLQGLPPEACAKVCETLAKDDIFCCNMDFGNGHLSCGGMSFTYKIESDSAFNALSHHAWKDLHQLFMKNQCPPLSGNDLERGLPYVVHLAHPDDEEDGSEPHQNGSPSSSEESDSSSDEQEPLSDSDGNFPGSHGERPRNSISQLPEWTTDNENGSPGTLERRGVGRPPKHRGDPDGPEKRGPGRPKSKTWSAKDEALLREKMALQLQRQGDLVLRVETCIDLLQLFPGRTRYAVKHKWSKMKETQNDSDARGGIVGALKAKAGAKKHHDKESGSFIEPDTDDEDGDKDGGVRRGLWTPEQDKLLSSRMESAMQSAGVTSMTQPPLSLQKELASLFGRKETGISRRWYHLCAGGRNGKGKHKKKSRKENPGPWVEAQNGVEDKIDDHEITRGSYGPVTSKNLIWTPERDQLLVNRMESELQSAGVATMPVPPAVQRELAGLFSVHERTISRRWELISESFTSSGNGEMKRQDKSDLVQKAPASSPRLQPSDDSGDSEAARIPGRTEHACRSYYNKHLRPSGGDPDLNSKLENDAPEELEGEERASDPSRGLISQEKGNKAKKASRAEDHQPKTAMKKIRNRTPWSRDEDDLLRRLVGTGIPWPDVAAQIPERTASACQVRYSAHLNNKPEHQQRLNGQPGRSTRRRIDSKPDRESDQESPEEADTVSWEARGPKHERESDDQSEDGSAGRRKKHRGAAPQPSSHRRHDRDDVSEAEDFDVYEFE